MKLKNRFFNSSIGFFYRRSRISCILKKKKIEKNVISTGYQNIRYINNAMITNTFVLYGRVQWFRVDFLERHDIELFVINIVQRTGVQTFLFQISIKQ